MDVPQTPDAIETVLQNSWSYKALSNQIDILSKAGEQPADIIMSLNVLAAELAIWFLYYDDDERFDN